MSFDIIKIHWSHALDFFKGQNFKLFILATLNNFFRSLKILLKEFPILFLVIFCSRLWNTYYGEVHASLTTESRNFITSSFFFLSISVLLISVALISFFFILAARPSIGLKNLPYFMTHLTKLWGFALFYMIIPELFYPFLIMSILFFLDLENKPRSFFYALKNGFKSYIDFFPVTLFLSFLFIIPLYGLVYLDVLSQRVQFTFLVTHQIHDFFIYFVSFPTIIFIVLLLYKFLLTSACTIYYVKIKHAHHQLFFDKK